ncbi:MAG: CRISPR-associated endoribonuclease Cas6 [Aphanizomenon flos-aquae KM1D3_PB]|uniref:CRISPR-associated endoribonuclease Cas6 n=1 Tax=Aphanizomenon flos-aquae TaxID=1176 RepID=UPI00054379C6|nr:CRISPR-associated endoribonuclease Cas6 [Aphanizomenon flos-aquae]KHG41266.1 CRISPR-associated protein Cas6 [Aphanizomenon flos-aquae 2012/KM1/D3]QSV70140.1 MAG: CRISPR-associated endoribonuclease Cas6 [Aphanizomenon flos-aquae KM1D3_PB]
MSELATSSKHKNPSKNTPLIWADDTELVSLVFELEVTDSTALYSQYTIGLHAWFLDQVRQINPTLSAYLHDSESEKPFSISALEGQLLPTGKQLQLQANYRYRWQINAISQPVVQFLSQWLTQPPTTLKLRDACLQVKQISIVNPPTTYNQLLQSSINHRNINLSFISPTSFRRKGHHFPLPVPFNLFHSYLRRWNDFSGMPIEQEAFLEWIDENVIIHKHCLESVKVAAGKRGSVTGFTGAISLGLTKTALDNPEFTQLFDALVQLAPYCGTGHKTTFGLGQTCLNWVNPESNTSSTAITNLLPERIEELTTIFTAQRKRIGGERTEKIATTWATILARREMGESLQVIAEDLEIPYTTAKTYVKLARRMLKDTQSNV